MPPSDRDAVRAWIGRKRGTEWPPYVAMLAEYDYWLNRGRYGQSRLLRTDVVQGNEGGRLQLLRSQYVETWADTVSRSMLNQFLLSEPMVKVPLGKTDIDDERERDRAEDFEFATLGLMRLADAQVAGALAGWSSFDQAAKAWLIRMGKVVAQQRVRRLRPGSTEAGVQVWLHDPKTFYHDFGNEYPRRFYADLSVEKERLGSVMGGYALPPSQHFQDAAKTDFITYGQLWEEALDPETGLVEVYSMWVIDDELVGRLGQEYDESGGGPLERRNLSRVPLSLGMTRFDPTQLTTWDGKSSGRGTHPVGIEWHAVPAWAGGSLEILNLVEVLEALSMDSTALGTLPPIVKRIKEGASQAEIMQTLYPGAQPTVTGQNVVWEVLTGLAQGQFQARETLERLYKRLDGYYNARLITAEANPGDATSLYDHEIQQWKATLTPVSRSIERFKRHFVLDLWDQFERAQDLKFTFQGKATAGSAYGRDIAIEFDVSRFPKRRAVEWLEPPNFPMNMNLAMQLATQGVDGGLFSREDAHSAFFKTQNAREMVKRAEADLLERQQPNVNEKLLEKYARELLAARDALAAVRKGKGADSDEYYTQFVLVESLKAKVKAKRLELRQGSSPRPAPAPARPGPAELSPEELGAFAPTAVRQAGAPGLPRPGALPNPASGIEEAA